LGLVYIDRIIQKHTQLSINSFNVHRLVISSILVASKFNDDNPYNNAFYAKVGGISVAELNLLELNFLKLIDFNLSIENHIYDRYHTELTKHLKLNPPATEKIYCDTTIYADLEGNYQLSALTFKRAYERLVEKEVNEKRLSPSIITRASELLLKEQLHKSHLSKGTVKYVSELIVTENKNLSPSLVNRACDLWFEVTKTNKTLTVV